MVVIIFKVVWFNFAFSYIICVPRWHICAYFLIFLHYAQTLCNIYEGIQEGLQMFFATLKNKIFPHLNIFLHHSLLGVLYDGTVVINTFTAHKQKVLPLTRLKAKRLHHIITELPSQVNENCIYQWNQCRRSTLLTMSSPAGKVTCWNIPTMNSDWTCQMPSRVCFSAAKATGRPAHCLTILTESWSWKFVYEVHSFIHLFQFSL